MSNINNDKIIDDQADDPTCEDAYKEQKVEMEQHSFNRNWGKYVEIMRDPSIGEHQTVNKFVDLLCGEDI